MIIEFLIERIPLGSCDLNILYFSFSQSAHIWIWVLTLLFAPWHPNCYVLSWERLLTHIDLLLSGINGKYFAEQVRLLEITCSFKRASSEENGYSSSYSNAFVLIKTVKIKIKCIFLVVVRVWMNGTYFWLLARRKEKPFCSSQWFLYIDIINDSKVANLALTRLCY